MPKPRRLRLTVDYGYDIHSLLIERFDWDVVLSGIPNVVDGQGFHVEGEKFDDSWHFNFEERGSLRVTYEDGGGVYEGNIFDGAVRVNGKPPYKGVIDQS